MYWLGEDPIVVRNAEIGARPNYFRRDPETPADFRRQMAHCFGLFRQVTLPHAVICMIIGRSVIKGKVIDNAELLRSAAGEHGFQHLASTSRRIPATRKASTRCIASSTPRPSWFFGGRNHEQSRAKASQLQILTL